MIVNNPVHPYNIIHVGKHYILTFMLFGEPMKEHIKIIKKEEDKISLLLMENVIKHISINKYNKNYFEKNKYIPTINLNKEDLIKVERKVERYE